MEDITAAAAFNYTHDAKTLKLVGRLNLVRIVSRPFQYPHLAMPHVKLLSESGHAT